MSEASEDEVMEQLERHETAMAKQALQNCDYVLCTLREMRPRAVLAEEKAHKLYDLTADAGQLVGSRAGADHEGKLAGLLEKAKTNWEKCQASLREIDEHIAECEKLRGELVARIPS